MPTKAVGCQLSPGSALRSQSNRQGMSEKEKYAFIPPCATGKRPFASALEARSSPPLPAASILCTTASHHFKALSTETIGMHQEHFSPPANLSPQLSTLCHFDQGLGGFGQGPPARPLSAAPSEAPGIARPAAGRGGGSINESVINITGESGRIMDVSGKVD
ncbi:hypothetical protein SKAU_G00054040 [Synaphobranchus kaupii]|uniref:Uncharacterized protein n=1 Tax=Synaphobranchus kaupii TaxID=118154 RepID=A0A9Q1G3K2_SYNKA|nr:hypothetical protein SKAU_G00054040 [Synaphobranchus kaupii]